MTYQFMQPYTFKNGVTLKNRMVMSPTTTMSSFYDGHVTNDEIKFYDVRAGGPEMIIGEVANVIASGKGFEGELSIADDGDIDGLSRLANAMKRGGTKAILQIFHAGRKSNDSILRGEQPVSASAVKAVFPSDSQTPRELAATEIDEIIVAFGEATRRAIAAGFDGVELLEPIPICSSSSSPLIPTAGRTNGVVTARPEWGLPKPSLPVCNRPLTRMLIGRFY